MASEKLITFSKTGQDLYLSPSSSRSALLPLISAFGGESWFVSEEGWSVIIRINAFNNPFVLNVVFDNSVVVV